MERGVTDHLAETILAYQREVKRLRAALETIAGRDPDKPTQHIQWAVAVATEALQN